MDKRSFLKKASLAGIASIVSFPSIGKILDSVSHLSPEEITKDEDFWRSIRDADTKSEIATLVVFVERL